MSFVGEKNYQNLSDEELICRIKSSDENAFVYLYERYLPKIRAMTYSFQGLGYDLDDLIQEATIGFFTAVNVFDFKQSGFSTFCYLCMRRWLISLIKQNNRKKSVPNYAVIYTDESLFELGVQNSPETDYIAKEDFIRLTDKIDKLLSQAERDVLYLYISGLNYNEIAKRLSVTRKSVDNALQRIRKKLR